LHGRQPAWRRQRCGCRASRLDLLRGRHGSVGEFIERGALRLGRLDRLLNEIDRQAGNIAAVLAAKLRQPVGRGIARAR